MSSLLLDSRHFQRNSHRVVVVAFRVVEMGDVEILVAEDANLAEAVLGHQVACYFQSLVDNLRLNKKFKCKFLKYSWIRSK